MQVQRLVSNGLSKPMIGSFELKSRSNPISDIALDELLVKKLRDEYETAFVQVRGDQFKH